jgi:hypothetical protein
MTNVVQRSSHGRAPRLCILSAAAILALLFVVPPPRPQGAMGLDAAARAFLQRCAVSHSLGARPETRVGVLGSLPGAHGVVAAGTMGKQAVRIKEVVYTLSNMENNVMPGLFKGFPAYVSKKVSENWLSASFFAVPFFGTL